MMNTPRLSFGIAVLAFAHAMASCQPKIEFSEGVSAAYDRYRAAPDNRVTKTPRFLAWFGTMTATRRGECVDYAGAARTIVAEGLRVRALEALASADPAKRPDARAHIAFWINAYNLTVFAGLIDAVQQAPSALVSDGGFDVLRTPQYEVEGVKIAPDWIHHGVLRGQFTHPSLAGIKRSTLEYLVDAHKAIGADFDPRIHFAHACGGTSCPVWGEQPYLGETLSIQLDEAVRRMLDSPRRGMTSDGISALFHWCARDFKAAGGPSGFIARYRPDEAIPAERSLDFSWRVATLRIDDPSCQPAVPMEPATPDDDLVDLPTTDETMPGPERTCEDGASRPCGPETAIGACEFGTETCIEGTWSACEGAIEASEERCNGLDDDCNGLPDDDIVEMPAEVCPGTVGVCAGLEVTCSSGRWTCNLPDTYQDAETLCDGIDNDCDGTVDESVIEPVDLKSCVGPGVCASGRSTCDAGVWTCQYGEVDIEINLETRCDGLDNDCDGAVDEALTDCRCLDGDEIPCSLNEGTCTVGVQRCENGQWNPCSGILPVAEDSVACDGKDNDCNGTIDDGVLNACGLCGPLPTEVCDSIDNDCDGRTDEGTINACGLCGDLPEETCNGSDDDCDGFVDEGVSNACGGCGDAGEERCNGVDDDCDGEVDESLTPPPDLVCPDEGVCASSGPAMCQGAAGFGCGSSSLYERDETLCDFQDNDCDGLIDEGLRNLCDFCGPQPIEACNHLDDDCDGEEDEGCPVDPNSQAIREP
ncbi:MAG: DUF547 domain-containing protein [Myxococcota bacterium]|nr:DUF547 domain-containing protein [Myxococcota bacterium]